jgi:hypothetical protein
MRMKTSYGGALVLLGGFVFSSAGFSVSLEPQTERAKQISSLVENAAAVESKGKGALKPFGVRIAGLYLVIRKPEDGSSRILTIFADGNLTSINSTQFEFGEGVVGAFSNQQGVWRRVGDGRVEATVLDFTYEPSTGDFFGTAVARYDLQFDRTFEAVTGRVEGKIFNPGVDPLNPGAVEPIAEFSDNFKAQRVTVGNSEAGGL